MDASTLGDADGLGERQRDRIRSLQVRNFDGV